MSLRLFHVTEFAQSQLLSPAFQRTAIHPYVVVVLFSAWLASACNLPLWQALSRLSEAGAGKVWWIGIGVAVMMTCAFVMLLSVLTWRWTLKFALTILLLLAAFNAYFMLVHSAFIDAGMINRILKNPGVQLRALLNWQLFTIVTLLGLLPAILLWRMPLRRTPLLRNLVQNLTLFVTTGIVLAGLWLYYHQMVLGLLKSQPQLRQMLNPFNMLHTPVQLLVSAL
jgi:lipid A ethanolaminephosphotransferase